MSDASDPQWWAARVRDDGQEERARVGPAVVYIAVWQRPRSARLVHSGEVVPVDLSPTVDIQNGVPVALLRVGVRWAFFARNDWA